MSQADIHPTAIVSSSEIGEGTQIGAYSIIGENVKIGAGCKIAPHVVIEGRTSIGDNCEVFQFASLGVKPQDLKFKNEPSTLQIGNNNVIREGVTMSPGTSHGLMKTVIGDNNLFMVGSHVAHDCVVGNNNVFANIATLAGHVEIGNNVILGGLIAIHQFVRVGDFAILSGGTMAVLDILPYSIAQGDRCKLRGVNKIALQRASFKEEEISDIKKVFRILYSSGSKLEVLVKKIKEKDESLLEKSYIRKILDFISSTSRGITPFSKNR